MPRVLEVLQVQGGLGVQLCSLCRIWSWREVLEVLGVLEVQVDRILGLRGNQAPQGAPGVPSQSLPSDPLVQGVQVNQDVPKTQPRLCLPSLL